MSDSITDDSQETLTPVNMYALPFRRLSLMSSQIYLGTDMHTFSVHTAVSWTHCKCVFRSVEVCVKYVKMNTDIVEYIV